MSLNQFEDFLKDKSEEFSMEPDPLTWAGIENNLPPEKKKRKALFFWIPAFAASFVALFILVDAFNNNAPNSTASANTPPTSIAASPASTLTPESKDSSQRPEQISGESSVPIPVNTVSQGQASEITSPNNSPNEGIRDDDSRFAKTCKRSVLNFPFLDPSVEHSDPNKILEFPEHTMSSIYEKPELKKDPDSNSNLPVNLISDHSPNLKKDSMNLKKDNMNRSDDSTHPSNETPDKFRWFAFVEGMPHFTTSRIRIEPSYKNTEPYASDCRSRKADDKGRINASFSLGFGIKIKEHHSISIGVRYLGISHSLTVYNVDNSVISGIPNRYTTFDYSSSDSFKSFNSFGGGGAGGSSFPAGPVVNKYSYIGIPINYGYSFNFNTKFGMGINAGIGYNRLYKQSGIAHQTNSDVYIKSENASVKSVSKSHFSGQLSLQFNYQFNSNSILYMQVMGIRSLNPIEKDIVRTGYNSLGLSLGYAYFFGKK